MASEADPTILFIHFFCSVYSRCISFYFVSLLIYLFKLIYLSQGIIGEIGKERLKMLVMATEADLTTLRPHLEPLAGQVR